MPFYKTVSLVQKLWEGSILTGKVLAAAARPGIAAEVVRNQCLTMVQFGDYAEGYTRLKNNGPETYYAQRYAVDFIGSLAARPDLHSVTVICVSNDAPSVTLTNRVHTSGIELYPKGRPPRYRQLIERVRATRPTHLIVAFPCIPLLAWAVHARIPVLPMFADSFRSTGLNARIQHRLLTLLLRGAAIELVANHNLAASLELQRIGVPSAKIVPFDWPALISPTEYEPKSAPARDGPFRILYVGNLLETKGVGDAIRATASLRARGRQVALSIIGKGESEFYQRLAIAEGAEERVGFLGPKSHSDVIAAMRDHDAVIVPSHWAYPEGLPMTLYEALCTRTPLLTSDHPMFALRIRHGYNALVFPERNTEAIAACVETLATSPDLYQRLSAGAGAAAEGYLCPLKYAQLIDDFLNPSRRRQLLRFSLAEFNYMLKQVG